MRANMPRSERNFIGGPLLCNDTKLSKIEGVAKDSVLHELNWELNQGSSIPPHHKRLKTTVCCVCFRYKDAQTAAYLVIALRVIMGLASGVSFPAMHSLWGRWAPPYERSKLMVLCYSGTMVRTHCRSQLPACF